MILMPIVRQMALQEVHKSKCNMCLDRADQARLPAQVSTAPGMVPIWRQPERKMTDYGAARTGPAKRMNTGETLVGTGICVIRDAPAQNRVDGPISTKVHTLLDRVSKMEDIDDSLLPLTNKIQARYSTME